MPQTLLVRDLSRSRAVLDAARGRGAVFAVFGQPRPDARIGGTGARLWRGPAHAPRGKRPRRCLQPRALRYDAGGLADPVAALVFCAPQAVHWNVIHGRVVVRAGRLTTVDLLPHLERHNTLAHALAVAAR